MAISDLHCVRSGEGIVVTWAWDTGGQKTAHITVKSLLDETALTERDVSVAAYRNAIITPLGGPMLKVPEIPLEVTVSDADNEQKVELIDKRYTVAWQIVHQNIYQTGLFGKKRLLRTETSMRLRFPCEGHVPDDLFYYVAGGQGGEERVGYLPALRQGDNLYGMLAAGQRIKLCCNPRHEKTSRLFDLKQVPDAEL